MTTCRRASRAALDAVSAYRAGAQGARGRLLHRRDAALHRRAPRTAGDDARLEHHHACSRRRRISASRANCRSSSIRASWPCSKQRCIARAFSRARRWARHSPLLRSQDPALETGGQQYLKGERARPNDLMAWNADGTRMPWRMHTEYLYALYLRQRAWRTNALHGRRKRSTFATSSVPMFVVGTEADHVAPWASVYKARRARALGRPARSC